MTIHTSPGIVLKRTRHLEDDSRVTVFLRDLGKVTALSKGSQRYGSKLRILMEPFVEADYQVFLPLHGVTARIISGRLLNSHPQIRHHLAAFEMASKCCEIIDNMFPFRAPSPPVYDILQHALQSQNGSAEPKAEWMLFLRSLLKNLGHGDHLPHLQKIKSDQEGSVERCIAFLENHLDEVMPRKLKSDIFREPVSARKAI